MNRREVLKAYREYKDTCDDGYGNDVGTGRKLMTYIQFMHHLMFCLKHEKGED